MILPIIIGVCLCVYYVRMYIKHRNVCLICKVLMESDVKWE